jgi:hypothetical protein
VPGIAGRIPSLYTAAKEIVPGLDMMRRIIHVVIGLHMVLAILAGYGAAALATNRRWPARMAVATGCILAALCEIFTPALARLSYGREISMVARPLRPPDTQLALLDQVTDGAVLDIPFELQTLHFARVTAAILRGAYHGQPVAACYNSYSLPLNADIGVLAARVRTDARAGDALAALGIRNVVVLESSGGRSLNTGVTTSSQLRFVGRAAGTALYHVESAAPVVTDFSALGTGMAPVEPVELTPPASEVAVRFVNTTRATYRHPEPLVPSDLLIRWTDRNATIVHEQRLRALLPIALAAGESTTRRLHLEVPEDSTAVELTLARAQDPERALSTLAVRIVTSR